MCNSLHISHPRDFCLCVFTIHVVNIFALLRLSVSTDVTFRAIRSVNVSDGAKYYCR